MIAEEIIQIDENATTIRYKYQEGAFYHFNDPNNPKDTTVVRVRTCRETFSAFFQENSSRIGFVKTGLNINSLNDFFELIENKLKLENRTVFNRTSFGDAVIVNVPEFWRATVPRRQLFTLFLRCGGAFFNGDFDAAITNYGLPNQIKPLINHFLKGHINHTYPAKEENGLVSIFSGSNEVAVRQSFNGGPELTIEEKVLTCKLDF